MEDSVYRPGRVAVSGYRSATRSYATVDVLDLNGPLDRAVALCMDQVANYKASTLAGKMVASRTKGLPAALYAIGPDLSISKIGHTASPADRLCQLQTGNWHSLSIQGLVWFDSGAGAVERLVHEAVAEMNIGLRGEWIEADPTEAVTLMLKAARYSKLNAYDSAAWLRNWGARTQAYADAAGITDRLAG